jgi:hypothetical protein
MTTCTKYEWFGARIFLHARLSHGIFCTGSTDRSKDQPLQIRSAPAATGRFLVRLVQESSMRPVDTGGTDQFQIRRAASTTSLSFSHWRSSVMRFPSAVDAKPH